MRLVVRRIYRAFPELDGYAEDQCRRFVGAANRGWRRGAHWLVILTVVAAGVMGSFRAANSALEAADEYQNAQRRDVLWVDVLAHVATVPLFFIGPLAGLVARDMLLRRRIGRILRRESSCPKCQYGLIGLGVSPESTITCPECGFVADVDPSLSELTLTAAGKREFRPAIIPPPQPKFWTRRRVRLLVRVAAVLILTPLVLWGGLVWWVARQVGDAVAWKPASSAALIESRQPGGAGPQALNGWPALEAAASAVRAVDQDAWGSLLPYNAHPLLILVDRSPGAQLSPQELQEQVDRANEVMSNYRRAGVYDRLREMAACPRATRDPNDPTQAWAFMRMMMYNSGHAQLMDICAVRMELARRSGDLEEFTQALEARLALARILRQQVDGVSLNLSATIENAVFTELEAMLAGAPSQPWLDAVDAVVRRQCTPLPTTQLFDRDEAGVMGMVQEQFVQLGQVPHSEVQFIEIAYEAYRWGGRVGAFHEYRDTAAAYFKDITAYAALPPFKRTMPAPMPPGGNLIYFRYFFPDELATVRALDESLLHRRAFDALMALERFRIARGDYPQKLEELVPEFLKALPEDPWSGKPLAYKRVDPATDRQKRTFLLYSVGNDRTDNGGYFIPQQVDKARLLDSSPGVGAQGFDYILNERPEEEP